MASTLFKIGDLVKISDSILLLIAETAKNKSNNLLGIIIDTAPIIEKVKVAWNDEHPPTMESIYDLELLSKP